MANREEPSAAGRVRRLLRGLSAVVVVVALGAGLALGSGLVVRQERAFPDVVCPLPGGDPEGWCGTKPAGGWPVVFVVDNPAASIVGQLGPEDDFFPGGFLADTAIWALLPTAGVVALRGRRRRDG